jgi:hypothetical protein
MGDDKQTEMAEALVRLEEKVEHLGTRISTLLDGQRQNFQCLNRALHGTGDTPGLVVRVDRVEQWRARHGRLVGLLLTAVLPLVAVRVWDAFKGGA